MIMGITGGLGSGKSTTGVMIGYWNKTREHMRVISNFPLGFEHDLWTLQYFKEHINDEMLDDAAVLWDEAHQEADSRTSGSKINIELANYSKESRKRGVDIYVITQDIGDVEKRIRKLVDIHAACSYKEFNCKVCKGTGIVKGELCEECLGFHSMINRRNPFTVVGYVTVHFWMRHRGIYYILGNMVTQKRFNMTYKANEFWVLFDTRQRMPRRKELLDRLNTEEVETYSRKPVEVMA